MIPIDKNGDFFRYWFEILKPFHHLTNRAMDVATALIRKRYELGKVINDVQILDKILFSTDVQKEIRSECKLSVPQYYAILSKLRSSNVVIDNKINTKFIPNIKDDDDKFKLLILFDRK
jgi:hypothetical protein